jgi:GGDEF domain-containing protein
MAHSARPLRITVVSPEIAVLHELAWMLTAVGYSVTTSKDLSENASWRQFSDADMLIFDGRGIPSPTAATLAIHSNNPLYRFFLYDPTAGADLGAWFGAGANDALRTPVSRGELLVRARVGARTLEFENRLKAQTTASELPGIYSTRGLLRQLTKLSSERASVSWGHTLVTTTIDFFSGLRRQEGEPAAQSLLAKLAATIQQSANGTAITGYVGDGTFQALLPGRKVTAAHVIAEHIANTFRLAQHDREICVSLTTAVVSWQLGMSPERLLELGHEILAIAKQSGGDCAIEQSTFAQELSNWQQELTIGSPLANVVAQDIMEPFPFVLKQGGANQPMIAALRRSGLPIWPVVNPEGRLIGVTMPTAKDVTAEWNHDSTDQPGLSNPVTIAHNAPFPEIYETFSKEGCPEIIVVADHRPIGYLSFDNFISLIEPINSETYASEMPVNEDSGSLLVGSTASGSGQASGSDQ